MSVRHKQKGKTFRQRAKRFAGSGKHAAPVDWLVDKHKHKSPVHLPGYNPFGLPGAVGAAALVAHDPATAEVIARMHDEKERRARAKMTFWRGKLLDALRQVAAKQVNPEVSGGDDNTDTTKRKNQ